MFNSCLFLLNVSIFTGDVLMRLGQIVMETELVLDTPMKEVFNLSSVQEHFLTVVCAARASTLVSQTSLVVFS